MINIDKLKDKISSLPDSPGVYIFKDRKGEVIYVGKAKSLKKRVQSYFSRFLSAKTQAMVSKVCDIEYILLSSEGQAQLLEAELIKEKQPQYNVSLKDDKSFPLIRITEEEFPVVSIYRRKKAQRQDASAYFGPYPNAQLLRSALKMIRRIFSFRSCQRMPKQACLYYRLQLCPAPCIGKISSRRYRENINGIKMFLESKYEELIDKLRQRMQEASGGSCFEEAAKIRDQISALSVIGKGWRGLSALNELEELKNLLRLDKAPQRIEAFDISNILGKEATASMVSFYKGSPDKNNYRRFRIKTVEAIDDYRMLGEAIRRRYLRLQKENLPFPDLVLVDGGRSHLLAANKQLEQLGIDIPLLGIAKDKENIYARDRKKPIRLTEGSPALNLIRRIRDEAHRFARAYHHILRRKKIIGR